MCIATTVPVIYIITPSGPVVTGSYGYTNPLRKRPRVYLGTISEWSNEDFLNDAMKPFTDKSEADLGLVRVVRHNFRYTATLYSKWKLYGKSIKLDTTV